MGNSLRWAASSVILLGGLAAGCASAAQGVGEYGAEDPAAEGVVAWHGVLRPYVWVPAFDGSMALDGTRAEAKGNPWSFAYGVAVETANDRFAAVGDASWVLLTGGIDPSAFSPGPAFVDAKQRFTVVEVAAGPCLLDRPKAGLRVDLLLGARAERHWLEFRSAYGDKRTVDDNTWVDPTAGARILWQPLKSVGFEVRGDVGFAAMSGPTWEAFVGIAVGDPRAAHLALGFRALRVDFERGHDSFGISTHLTGAWIGMEFGF